MISDEKASILVVDDSRVKRLALVSVLEELDQNIVIAESGRDALRLLLSHEYAVILMDVQMPGMDGFETATLIRSRKRSEVTPIIFVTAYAQAEMDMLHGYSQGAVDYIFTPIIPEILRAKVSTFVDLHHKTREIKRREEHLESLVERRTAALMAEIAERNRARQEVLKLNEELEQKVLERTRQLQATNQELESFCYSVSHDLRAPLRSINGFSRALIEDLGDDLPGQSRQHLDRIMAASLRMGQLIEDLLSLSCVSRMELVREEVDFSGMAEEIIRDLQLHDPDYQVDVSIEAGILSDGDSKLLRIVLENLLNNAWKFTSKQEHPRVEVGMMIDGEREIYYVRDNGAGFDMTYADKLFGAFQRLHAMDEYPGTGIGLATVQRIINRHGGRIWFHSSPGNGAVFYFTLKPDNQDPAGEPLLLIEDNLN